MKKPTPQISPRHCKECGQIIGSVHCECVCSCNQCRAGFTNHCTGPNAAANQAKWRADYNDAAAELAFILATGSMPSDEAREQFKQRVRDASQRAKQPKATE